jgi:hypothetical protein
MGGYDDKSVFSDPRKSGSPLADWPVTAFVLGQWEPNGQPISMHADYQLWRPLGNDNGVATGDLTGQGRQGWAYRYQEYNDADPENIVTSLYPITNMPFELKIERQYIDDDGFPQIPHGWKVTMISEDPQRDITARGIGVYDANWNYLYTTGSFVPDGNTYSTVCPVGQRTADEVDVYFKLLLGSAPEGEWVLPVGQQEDLRQFWAADQA